MPRLSIVIPVLGDPQQFEDTLVSVLENRPVGCEIVVALNQPYDDPYDLQGEVRFVVGPSGAGLAELLNLALPACHGTIVHVLRCGVTATAGWCETALQHFDDRRVAIVVPRASRAGDDRAIAATLTCPADDHSPRAALETAAPTAGQLHRRPYGPDSLAPFYRRGALEIVDGFAADVGDDWLGADTALRLALAGYAAATAGDAHVLIDASKFVPPPAMRRGWQAERFFWRWAPWAGWQRSLATHAAAMLGQCLLCLLRPSVLGELCGRAMALLSIPAQRRHWQAIARAMAARDGLKATQDDTAASRRREAA